MKWLQWVILLSSSILQLGSEEIYSGTGIMQPSYAGIHEPAPVTIRDMDYSRIYHVPQIQAPGGYNHYNQLYFNQYNYQMQPYPYMAYTGRGPNAPTYPMQRNTRNSTSSPEFSGARIVHERATISESGRQVVNANTMRQVWVQSVGGLKMPPVIANGQVAAVVGSSQSTNALIIEEVKKNGEKIQVLLKRANDRSFYQEDSQKPGILSVAVFSKGNLEVEFVAPSQRESTASTTSQDDILPHQFVRRGLYTWELEDLNTPTSHSSSDTGRFVKALYSLEDAKSYLEVFKFKPSFESILDGINFDRQVLYLVGRYFRTRQRAELLSSLEYVKITPQVSGNEIIHKIFYTEKPEAVDELSARSVMEEDKDKVVLSGAYAVVEKPRNLYRRPSFHFQDRRVASHTGSLD
ncbi:MAG: hypothetical protein H3C47_05520 [Candidatus Cloacimonetes bacterium]|nr:hypothetical protein [Candidatus Cloacimonadota bacterium]